MKRWKFIRKNFKSKNGNVKWTIGKWQKPVKDLVFCESGYHCSKTIYQAFSYVQGEILCQVECKGKNIKDANKEIWENQRIVRAWKWTKKDSVALAVYAAELCIDNFEKEYPDDKRPREAIEAAKKWLKSPTEANRITVDHIAESIAWSNEVTLSTTKSAVWSVSKTIAWYAAKSAEATAWSAGSTTSADWYAAESTMSAAWSTRYTAVTKITKWMNDRLKVLEEIK